MATLNSEQFIEVFPFFRDSPPKLIGDILFSSRHAFRCRDTVTQLEGELCTDLELMLSGEKRVYKSSPASREITLYEVGRGEACILNTISILSDVPCPVNAVTITDVNSLLIPARDFQKLLSNYEEMRAFVFGSISQRLATVLELLSAIVFAKMDQRLFDYLVEKSENGTLSMTHQQIANDLGTAREVVSRLLKDFERKGKVALSRGCIQLITPFFEER